MKSTRRQFLKASSLFTTGLYFNQAMPSSIQKALSIEPLANSDFTDAEHIVFLMQENRSFDHAYGTLKGVRGFNDPRAMLQPSGLPVWFQQDKLNNEIYGPFHLDIANTKITWMGSLPHSWKDMVQARSNGNMDNWIDAKRSSSVKESPLTMGYFQRQDIPFYYALADAFTVCDQHFCSSLTGTSANRSYFWSGTVRHNPNDPESVAHVDNHQINYKDVSWRTYPELLEKQGVSWRIYQNELSIPVGLDAEQESWLSNFTNNNLEFHKQYNVRLHQGHTQYLGLELQRVEDSLRDKSLDEKQKQELNKKRSLLQEDIKKYNPNAFEELSDFQKAIHKKAFTTNIADPNYHQVEKSTYEHIGQSKTAVLPKGDILYEFRKDVDSGNLPLVSWLVAPANFSDHPGAPWFGAWYVSEVMDILTKDPKVFQKTIFVLTYDENDGYFDHVAPFVPSFQGDLSTGKMSKDLYSQQEWVTKAQDRIRTGNAKSELQSPIGLGFRVPMVVVSPWSKGGWVNSEVLDLTSTIQFLEYFIHKKTGKNIIEQNISPFRRAISGNMTSVFQNTRDQSKVELDFVERQAFVQSILNAKDKDAPEHFNAYSMQSVLKAKADYRDLPGFASQEKGIKKACALPYNILANISQNNQGLHLEFTTQTLLTSNKLYGAPLQVYSIGDYAQRKGANWDFTVQKDDNLEFDWQKDLFLEDKMHLVMHGPNGFYRSFSQTKQDAPLQVKVSYSLKKELLVELRNTSDSTLDCVLQDKIYLKQRKNHRLSPKQIKSVLLDYSAFKGWYELEVTLEDEVMFQQIYAGHIEDGTPSITDPYMGSLS